MHNHLNSVELVPIAKPASIPDFQEIFKDMKLPDGCSLKVELNGRPRVFVEGEHIDDLVKQEITQSTMRFNLRVRDDVTPTDREQA